MLKLLREQVPTKPRVIVLERARLTEDEISKALEGNSGSQWYKAIVSKIETLRESNILAASLAASANNTLGMAGALNAYEALSGLLDELDQYATKEKA
jgi:hypothetical protein